MKTKIINALRANFEANIIKHKMNIEIMLDNPMGIPEHTDFMESIEKELQMLAEYSDKLEALEVLD